MRLVQFLDEFLHKSSIERNVSDHFASTRALGRSFDFLVRSDQLRFKEHELVVATFELKVLAHEIGQISTNLDLHVMRDRADGIIINQQV